MEDRINIASFVLAVCALERHANNHGPGICDRRAERMLRGKRESVRGSIRKRDNAGERGRHACRFGDDNAGTFDADLIVSKSKSNGLPDVVFDINFIDFEIVADIANKKPGGCGVVGCAKFGKGKISSGHAPPSGMMSGNVNADF